MLCSNLKYPKFSHNSKCVVSYIPHLSRVSFLWRKPTSEQAIQLLAPIFYSVRARGFCCCPVDSAVPFYQKLILLFFEKEGICCGRCLPFWVETAIGFFALQRFSCTAEMNAADAGMLAVAGGLNGVRCPVLGS